MGATTASPYAGMTMAEAIAQIVEDGRAEAEAEAAAYEAEAAAWNGEDL